MKRKIRSLAERQTPPVRKSIVTKSYATPTQVTPVQVVRIQGR